MMKYIASYILRVTGHKMTNVALFKKSIAPGEARTHGLQIMRLTRCLLRYRGLLYSVAAMKRQALPSNET